MVGAFTGMSKHFTVSVNYRVLPSFDAKQTLLKDSRIFRIADKALKNVNYYSGYDEDIGVKDTLSSYMSSSDANEILILFWRLLLLTDSKTFTVASLVMDTLISAESYEDAVDMLCAARIASPVYFLLIANDEWRKEVPTGVFIIDDNHVDIAWQHVDYSSIRLFRIHMCIENFAWVNLTKCVWDIV
jgi:hypothetical protein